MSSLTILGLGWQAWYTVVVVLAMFLSLIYTKIRTEMAFLATITALFVAGVLDIKGAFGGFSSESVLVVAVLFVVIAGLTNTGVLNWIVKHLMGTPRTLSGAITRLMLPVAALSSVLSNTTVVALFIKVVKMWSRSLGIAPSKLLIPLSYASGMGGICTLIGTPPNLIISGFYTDDTGIRLSIFTPTLCGLFCLAVGVLSTIALQRLLPTRRSEMDRTDVDDFTAELTVPATSPYVGMTLQEALNDRGLVSTEATLIAIRSFDNEIVSPVPSDTFILGGDRLVVSGSAGSILRMAQALSLQYDDLNGVLENAAAEAGKGHKTLLSTLIMVAMVLLSAFNIVPLLQSCLLAAAAMIVCGCCSSAQAMRALDWNIIIVFAGSVAIGKAIEQTGIAEMIASGLLSLCGTNPYVVLATLCLVATFITEFISNTAAGAMFYPIAMSAATAIGANPLTFCVALMIAASSSFATPIGSPTHMLVYAPGGYRFTDFMRIGLPMNLIILAANIFITTVVFPF